VLFGTGVSVASVIQLRQTLDAQGFNAAKIVGSSGFNLFKCKMFANAVRRWTWWHGFFHPGETSRTPSPPPTSTCTKASPASSWGRETFQGLKA